MLDIPYENIIGSDTALAARDQGAALGRILTGKQDRFDPPAYTPILKIGGIQLKEICRDAAQS